MALLRILNGSLENQEIELSPDPMTIGRASACNIRIADLRLAVLVGPESDGHQLPR